MTMTNPRILFWGLRKIVTVFSLLYSQDYHFPVLRNFFTERKHCHDSNKKVGQMSKELGRKFSLVKIEKRIWLETTSALFAL